VPQAQPSPHVQLAPQAQFGPQAQLVPQVQPAPQRQFSPHWQPGRRLVAFVVVVDIVCSLFVAAGASCPRLTP